MKKKLLVLIVVAGWNYNHNKNEARMSELGLANIEALAGEEGGSGDKIISDELRSTEITDSGIKSNWYRNCSYGGSQYCASGAWSSFTPRY